jgi:hypothetical protein
VTEVDVAQWEFYVVPAGAAHGSGYRSASIGSVRQDASASPMGFGEHLADSRLAYLIWS